MLHGVLLHCLLMTVDPKVMMKLVFFGCRQWSVWCAWSLNYAILQG